MINLILASELLLLGMIGECFILLIVLVNKSKKDSTYSEQYVQEELHHISIPRCYYDSGNSKYSRTAKYYSGTTVRSKPLIMVR